MPGERTLQQGRLGLFIFNFTYHAENEIAHLLHGTQLEEWNVKQKGSTVKMHVYCGKQLCLQYLPGEGGEGGGGPGQGGGL